MAEIDDVVVAAFGLLAQKAEPKLAAALAAQGIQSARELPAEVARKIFADCLVAAAAESFPDARLDALKHGMTAFQHPQFGAAFSRLKAVLDAPTDAFAFAAGPEAAIVLAAFGLPVAPFDRKTPRILAEPSNDIDVMQRSFAKWKTAYVGYSPCDIPFYILLTDCMRTMRTQVLSHPRLHEAKKLLERAGMEPPRGPFPPFKHGMILIPREPGDTISTVMLSNPNPHEGSVALYAGWTINAKRDGAPNQGFLPVPMQFLLGALQDPQIAMWIWRPVGVRVTIN